MNQTHKMSLREGALGHWVVGHVLKRLNVEEMGVFWFKNFHYRDTKAQRRAKLQRRHFERSERMQFGFKS